MNNTRRSRKFWRNSRRSWPVRDNLNYYEIIPTITSDLEENKTSKTIWNTRKTKKSSLEYKEGKNKWSGRKQDKEEKIDGYGKKQDEEDKTKGCRRKQDKEDKNKGPRIKKYKEE